MRGPLRAYAICAALFALSWISFQYNALGVAYDPLFLVNQLDAEQSVLDGLVRTELFGDKPRLGHYIRPDIPDQHLRAYELFDSRHTSGEFVEYRSQFGAQADLSDFLYRKVGLSIEQLHMLWSTLMAAVVVLFFVGLKAEFSELASALFSAALLTSPWVASVARNLYWIEASLFVPMLVSIWLGRAAAGPSARYRTWLSIALFSAFLVRFLFGFDYITTVVLAATAPLIYFGMKYGRARIIALLACVAMSSIGAFVVAIALLMGRYFDSFADGFTFIKVSTEKRFYARDPETTAREACEPHGDPQCIEEFVTSLRASPISVLGTYFVFPHSFVPGLTRYKESIDGELKGELMEARKQRSVRLLVDVFQRHGMFAVLPAALVYINEAYVFFLLIGLVVWKAFRKATPWYWRATLVTSLAAPVSWFVMAKAHSFTHTHVNYMLWYLPFVPICLLFLLDRPCTATVDDPSKPAGLRAS
jgi:hypothetical protein